MKLTAAALARVSLATTLGCSTVSISQPLGDPASKADHKALEGSWIGRGGDEGQILDVRVTKRGELFIGIMEWNEGKKQFEAETMPLRLTKSSNLRFLNAGEDPESPAKRFALLACYEIEDEKTVRVYFPVTEVFEKAVAAKKLAGTVEKKQFSTLVRLEATSEEVLKFIEESSPDVCFDKQDGPTFKLLHRPE